MFLHTVAAPRSQPHKASRGFSEDRARGKFGQRYLLLSEHPYLHWDAIEHWKGAWRKAAGADVPVTVFTAPQIDFERLLGVGSTIPMFETLHLVIVHSVEKLPEGRQEEFLRILRNSPVSTKWILTSHSVDRRKTFIKTLLSLTTLEEFSKVYPDRIPGWVSRIASEFDATLSPAAIESVAAAYGTDLFAVRQAIERAVLYAGRKRRIEEADVEIVLTGEGETTIFELIEAASRRDFATALAIGRSLLAEGEVLHLWLALIYGQLLRFSQLLDLTQQEAALRLHLSPEFATRLHGQATAFGHDGLVDAVSAVYETDWASKTSTIQPGLAWELLIWRLCGHRVRLSRPLFDLESSTFRE